MASLKLTVLELLAKCGEMTVQELRARTDLLMMDAVRHDLEVENLVTDKLEIEYTPGHLLCNTHPSKIFAGSAVTLTDAKKVTHSNGLLSTASSQSRL